MEPDTIDGPDFEVGVATSEVTEEGMVGMYQGEEVLLLRHEGRLIAIGARCTHYGALLVGSRIFGGQLRCPWHHAGFCIDTGRAERAPALSDLPVYDVTETGGRVIVTGRRSPHPPHKKDSVGHVVVIGGGAAGMAAVETLRREGHQGQVTLIDRAGIPVDRPNLSKDYLAGNAPEAWLHPRDASFYEGLDVNLLVGEVDGVDADRRAVFLKDMDIGYDALLIATGALPRRLHVEGADGSHVHVLRSLEHCKRIIVSSAGLRGAVVLGAGFLGLEVADALTSRGLSVTVVAPELVPLERVLGVELGREVVARAEASGVRMLLGRRCTRIRGDGVVLDDGTVVDAQLVVVAIGVTPEPSVAAAAGVDMGADGSILVDAHLNTNRPGIWAAGDVASWWSPRFRTHLRSEHWVTAQRMGQIAAKNMLGQARPFDAVPFFWTTVAGLDIKWVGQPVGFDAYTIDGSISAHDCCVTYTRNGETVAVATVGRDLESLDAERNLERVAASTVSPTEDR